MVLVDTPVWSLALRRRAVDLSPLERHLTQALYELVRKHQASLLGSTRQEVLSGIREESQFRRIRDHLRDFPNISLDSGDHEEAARISNECRRSGVASSPIDMLLCAVSIRYDWQIFTTDGDFAHYRKVVGIELFLPAKRDLRN
jgi:predicted nucleic acid-binding protein